MVIWRVLGNSRIVQFVAELWITGDEMERSFARRRSTEPFYPVFSSDCLLPSSLYCRNDLICDFVPSSDCRRWLPVDTWHGRGWVFPVPCLLSGPGGDLAVPGRSDGIKLYYPSSTVLHTIRGHLHFHSWTARWHSRATLACFTSNT